MDPFGSSFTYSTSLEGDGASSQSDLSFPNLARKSRLNNGKVRVCSTTSSLSSSSSAAGTKKTPRCVSLKKSALTRRGYKSFEDWNSDPNHVYIGRNMTHHVAGAVGSKWGNPYKADKTNKKSLYRCLRRYERHIRKNPDLLNAVAELEGKEIGCWCKPSPCHGDILVKIFKERQGTNSCSLSSDNQLHNSVITPSVGASLRLNGGT